MASRQITPTLLKPRPVCHEHPRKCSSLQPTHRLALPFCFVNGKLVVPTALPPCHQGIGIPNPFLYDVQQFVHPLGDLFYMDMEPVSQKGATEVNTCLFVVTEGTELNGVRLLWIVPYFFPITVEALDGIGPFHRFVLAVRPNPDDLPCDFGIPESQPTHMVNGVAVR